MELCYCCLSLFLRVLCSIVAFSDFTGWLGIRKMKWPVRKPVLATCKDFLIEVSREPNSWWVWKTWPVKQKPRERRRKSSISLCIYSHCSEHWGSLDMWNVKIILIGSCVVQQQWRQRQWGCLRRWGDTLGWVKDGKKSLVLSWENAQVWHKWRNQSPANAGSCGQQFLNLLIAIYVMAVFS